MNSIEINQTKTNQFQKEIKTSQINNHDFNEILDRIKYKEIDFQVKLSKEMKSLITIVLLTNLQANKQLKAHIKTAVENSINPIAIQEAIMQCSPYLGFIKTQEALEIALNIFQSNNVDLPLKNQKQTNDKNRFDEGLKVQKQIFGEVIDKMHSTTAINQKHIQTILSTFCFGDIYTRSGLTLQEREILTLSILISLGGCENQIKSHIIGNLNIGNSEETIISVITQCLAYVGFPRVLNALNCLNQIISK